MGPGFVFLYPGWLCAISGRPGIGGEWGGGEWGGGEFGGGEWGGGEWRW